MTKFLVLLLLFVPQAYAQNSYKLQTVKIIGGSEESYKEPGSIYQVSEKDIQKKGGTNAHEILKDVPGVSVQQEDGLGLRPNIGLRGTHPHRSKKITLLEDGVLIAPAPYSAPAAYYFPLMNKVTGVEVYKGPSSIKYGPNSIGGAINFLTRDYSDKIESELELSYGSFETLKAGAWTSGSQNGLSWLGEYHYIESGGFKNLSGGGDTGFEKNDLLIKARYRFKGDTERSLSFKFSYGNEDSNETYLGTSLEDFSSDPYQRYEASRPDKMSWDHRQYQLNFFNQWTETFFSDVTLYRNEFQRLWDKLNGFADSSISSQDVLLNPRGQNKDFLDVLKGQKDSSPSEKLRYGINDRVYFSQGINLENRLYLDLANYFDLGLLYHEDQIERRHRLQDADMVGGKIQKETASQDPNNTNKDKSSVLRTYLVYTYESPKWLFRLGGRFESVDTKAKDLVTQEVLKAHNNYFIPGWGLSYKITKNHLAFIGINKGVTLPGPGQGEAIEPEEAINYELGYRYRNKLFVTEAVAFYSDYSNLLGTCTFSAGCTSANLDSQYNGGKARVIGAEFLAGARPTFKKWQIPLKISATYTKATFDSNIDSLNKEWGVGAIRKGDPLPYIPELVFSTQVGAEYKKWAFNLSYNWRSKVYDQSVRQGRFEIENYGLVSAHLNYHATKKLETYLDVQNLFDKKYISSLRPFGARPGAPFWFNIGLRYGF